MVITIVQMVPTKLIVLAAMTNIDVQMVAVFKTVGGVMVGMIALTFPMKQ